jgi:hypothetical protein
MKDVNSSLPAIIDDGLTDGAGLDPLIKGKIIKYDKRRFVVGRDEGDALGWVLCVYRKRQARQKWYDNRLVAEIIEEPGGPPVESLEFTDNGPGEVQSVTAIYLRNLETAEDFTCLLKSTGGRIAIQELVDQITNMRALRPGAFPLVRLNNGTFRSRDFGLIDRPSFAVIGWCDDRGEVYPPLGVSKAAAAVTAPIETPKKPMTQQAKPPTDPVPDNSTSDTWNENEVPF